MKIFEYVPFGVREVVSYFGRPYVFNVIVDFVDVCV